MPRKSTAVLLAVVLSVMTVTMAVPNDGAAVDEAYKAMIEERREHEDMSERLALTIKFLEQYPESKYTARLIGHVYYYQGERLEDSPGAIAYAEALRTKLTNPEFVTDFDKRMVELYGEAGMLDKMTALAGKLESAGEMKFSDYWNIVQIATNHEEWGMVRTYCKKARPMANAETYRLDYPQYDFTDEEVQEAGNNRTAMVAGKDAWALANLGRLDDALAEFETTDEKLNRSYVGVPDYDIGLHWANTLLMKGDYDGAMKRFAPEALIMRNDAALAGFKKAYVGKNGGDEGFDQFAGSLHAKIAPTVEGFELPDYDGKRNKYADIRGDVTLLAFWFPT